MGKYDMTELREVINYLSSKEIKCELDTLYDGWQLGVPCVPRRGNCEYDIVLHEDSLGHEDGLLDLGFTDELPGFDHGYLTAADAIKLIEEYYARKENK